MQMSPFSAAAAAATWAGRLPRSGLGSPTSCRRTGSAAGMTLPRGGIANPLVGSSRQAAAGGGGLGSPLGGYRKRGERDGGTPGTRSTTAIRDGVGFGRVENGIRIVAARDQNDEQEKAAKELWEQLGTEVSLLPVVE